MLEINQSEDHTRPLFLNANGATFRNDPTFFLLEFPMISNALSTGALNENLPQLS
jgi:hypothetical protein